MYRSVKGYLSVPKISFKIYISMFTRSENYPKFYFLNYFNIVIYIFNVDLPL